MSRDIFTDPALDRPSSAPYVYQPGEHAASIIRAKNGESSSILGPMRPEMQSLMNKIWAEEDDERARKEAEMDTPENRQKAAEAEAAEKERRKMRFITRTPPRFMEEGWKHIRGEWVDEEIRVYTKNDDRRRFWGIKPAGMGMTDFWEQNDPDVSRFYDELAETWINALVPPPVTAYDENMPVIWAGRGLNPDLPPTEPTVPNPAPPTKATVKSRKSQKLPTVNPTHRVTKSTTGSPKVNQRTSKSLTSAIDAGHSGLADQTREVTADARADTTPKRARGRPATKAQPDVQDKISSTPKRPRGRPSAKSKPAVNEKDVKRPRGRPPAKEKPIETPSKQKKKTSAVKGNARVTKSSPKRTRSSAPSTHKMRTRGEGAAELLQL